MHFITAEQARSATDILCRRTMLFWDNLVNTALLTRVVTAMGEVLDWSESRCTAEMEAFCRYVEEQHRVTLDEKSNYSASA